MISRTTAKHQEVDPEAPAPGGACGMSSAGFLEQLSACGETYLPKGSLWFYSCMGLKGVNFGAEVCTVKLHVAFDDWHQMLLGES